MAKDKISSDRARGTGYKTGQVSRPKKGQGSVSRNIGGIFEAVRLMDPDLYKAEFEAGAKDAQDEPSTAVKRGGSGGGVSAAQKNMDRYARALQQMLTSGQYGQGADELLASQESANKQLQDLLATIGGQSREAITSSAQNLQRMLEAQQNPYANFQAQAAQVSPQLQQLLEAQGASTDPLAQYAAALNAANQAQASAFQNVGNIGSTAWQQGQQQMIGDVGTERDRALQALQNQQAQQLIALQQQLAGQRQEAIGSKQQARNNLLEMLFAAMRSGARPGPGSLF